MTRTRKVAAAPPARAIQKYRRPEGGEDANGRANKINTPWPVSRASVILSVITPLPRPFHSPPLRLPTKPTNSAGWTFSSLVANPTNSTTPTPLTAQAACQLQPPPAGFSAPGWGQGGDPVVIHLFPVRGKILAEAAYPYTKSALKSFSVNRPRSCARADLRAFHRVRTTMGLSRTEQGGSWRRCFALPGQAAARRQLTETAVRTSCASPEGFSALSAKERMIWAASTVMLAAAWFNTSITPGYSV